MDRRQMFIDWMEKKIKGFKLCSHGLCSMAESVREEEIAKELEDALKTFRRLYPSEDSPGRSCQTTLQVLTFIYNLARAQKNYKISDAVRTELHRLGEVARID